MSKTENRLKDANTVSSTDLLAIAIPPKDLIDMLKDSVWYSGGRDFGGKSGYSLEVDESTCYRDVLYDKVDLHETPEDAIYEYWKANVKEQPPALTRGTTENNNL